MTERYDGAMTENAGMTDEREGAPVRRWRRIAALLSALLIAGVIGGGVLLHDRAELQGRADAEKAATDSAERVVMSWLTYDYRTYRDDMTWVTKSGTVKFRKQFSTAALEGMRKRIVGPRQLISRGRVVNAAATATDADHVRVLLFTDQRLTDKEIRREAQPALHARSGVELAMVRSDGRWLVDDMVQLQFQ
jgi:hypothetical protein